MPAGVIDVTLPAPEEPRGPKAVIYEKAARLPREPGLGRSWEIAGQNLASAFGRAGLRGALSSEGLRETTAAALRRTGIAAAKGVAGVLVAHVVAKAVAAFVSTALRQTDIPEIARLDRAMGLVAGRVADTIEQNMPALTFATRVAVAGILPVRHAPAILPRVGALFMRSVELSMVVVARRTIALLTTQIGARIAAMPTTAGLEQGGTKIATPPVPGASVSLPGLPDVATSMSLGGQSFTSPQNIMPGESRDEVGTATAGGALSSGLTVASVASPAFLAAKVALDATMKWAEESAAQLLALEEDRQTAALDEAERLRAAIEGLAAAAPDGAMTPAPKVVPSHASMVDAANAAILEANDHARETWRNLEVSTGGILGALAESTRQFTVTSEGTITSALTPTGEALDGLNDALSLDLALVDKVTAESVRAERARQVVQIGSLAATAGIQAGLAAAKGVAELAAGRVAQAALHFAAAGLYGATLDLAIFHGASGHHRQEADVRDERTPQFEQQTDLIVILPGYSDPARIRDEIARSIQSGGVGQGGASFVGRPPRRVNLSRAAAQAALAAAGKFGSVGGLVGAGAGLLLGGPLGLLIGLELGFAFDEPISNELGRAGRRVDREFRRIRHSLGF